ncbi:unnamed protein product, partial [Choristocarpus tenellus]
MEDKGGNSGGTTDAMDTEPDNTLGGVTYLCGDCGSENLIKAKDPVQCRQCGYRIMYKMRTKR